MGGCNTCTETGGQKRSPRPTELRELIEKQRLSVLTLLLKENSLINEEFTIVDSIHHTPLSYSILRGKLRSLKHLLESLGASLEIMEKKLNQQGKSGLVLICEFGHLEILEYCLSFYQGREESHEENSVSFDFQKSVLGELKDHLTFTPIQIACQYGHIHILNYLLSKFQRPMPRGLDLDELDEFTGENCAMMACRHGNFAMVKFLHEICHCDFTIRNKRRESCILVTLSASRRRSYKNYFDILVYLVDSIGLSIVEDHEEALLLAENTNAVEFIERKISLEGISATKNDLEKANMIKRNPSSKSSKEEWLNTYEGSNFMIKQLIEEDADQSEVSIISDIHTEKVRTPFVSTFIPFQE